MTLQNAEIAAALDEIADLLEIQGANPFRVPAYRGAARTVGSWGRSVQAMVELGVDLDELPGVGPDLAGKIGEIVATGTRGGSRSRANSIPPGWPSRSTASTLDEAVALACLAQHAQQVDVARRALVEKADMRTPAVWTSCVPMLARTM
jgi:DNA polymerase/3'-5' exonuclease PolX